MVNTFGFGTPIVIAMYVDHSTQTANINIYTLRLITIVFSPSEPMGLSESKDYRGYVTNACICMCVDISVCLYVLLH